MICHNLQMAKNLNVHQIEGDVSGLRYNGCCFLISRQRIRLNIMVSKRLYMVNLYFKPAFN